MESDARVDDSVRRTQDFLSKVVPPPRSWVSWEENVREEEVPENEAKEGTCGNKTEKPTKALLPTHQCSDLASRLHSPILMDLISPAYVPSSSEDSLPVSE